MYLSAAVMKVATSTDGEHIASKGVHELRQLTRGICRGRGELCNPNGLFVLRVYARQVFAEIVRAVAVPEPV
jgi:hypothetical protein